MAIPRFPGWYRHQFRKTISSRRPENIWLLALDLNAIIHDAASKLKEITAISEDPQINRDYLLQEREKTFRNIFDQILNLVGVIQPAMILYIAVDGVAPFAKINQQRHRRYKSAGEQSEGTLFDSNAISPGTEFMEALDLFLTENIKLYSQSLPAHVIYSSHLIPGEGEHKIADYIRAHNELKSHGIVIEGNDSDLFMIYSLLVEKGWNRIFLHRSYESSRGNEIEYINLGAFVEDLKRKYVGAPSPVADFVVILFLNGNDFLPHFPSLQITATALHTLAIVAYPSFLEKNKGHSITQGDTINWHDFSLFIKFFSENYEDDLLRNWALDNQLTMAKPYIVDGSMIIRTEYHGNLPVTVTEFDIQKFYAYWYPYIFSKYRPYVIDPEEEDIKNMIMNYCEGITWVFNYYLNGVNSVNLLWYYAYHYAPIFSDLAQFIDQTPHIEGTRWPWEFKSIIIRQPFLTIPEMTVLMMPPSSLGIVHKELRNLYSEKSPISDLMPISFHLDIDSGVMAEYQFEAILPIPNPFRVIEAVSLLELPEKFTERFKGAIFERQDIERFPIPKKASSSMTSLVTPMVAPLIPATPFIPPEKIKRKVEKRLKQVIRVEIFE